MSDLEEVFEPTIGGDSTKSGDATRRPTNQAWPRLQPAADLHPQGLPFEAGVDAFADLSQAVRDLWLIRALLKPKPGSSYDGTSIWSA